MRLSSITSLLSLSAAITGPTAVCGQSSVGSDTVFAFVHVAVIPMDRERVLRDQAVIVHGSRITALGPASRITVPGGAIKIDGQGKFLIPGLADMHAHPLDNIEQPAMSDRLFLYLANGVTTIRDMHSGGRHPGPGVRRHASDSAGLALKHQLMRGEVLGPRLYTAGDPDESSPTAAARSVAELKADGHDFVKISFFLDVNSGLWPAPKPVYDSIITVARRVGLPVVGHVPLGLDVTGLTTPWVSTEHMGEYAEYVLGLNGRWSRDLGGTTATMRRDIADTAAWMKAGYQLDRMRLAELARALKRAGIWTCPTLNIWLYFRDLVDTMAKDPTYRTKAGIPDRFVPGVGNRYLEMNLRIVKALQDGGAGVLLGTDGSAFDVHPELALLVEAGLRPYQALATGTRNVAQFLGTLDSAGTVAVGKRADLVLLSGNPLDDIGYTAGPAGVMAGGRWLPRATIDAGLAAADSGLGALKERQRVWRH